MALWHSIWLKDLVCLENVSPCAHGGGNRCHASEEQSYECDFVWEVHSLPQIATWHIFCESDFPPRKGSVCYLRQEIHAMRDQEEREHGGRQIEQEVAPSGQRYGHKGEPWACCHDRSERGGRPQHGSEARNRIRLSVSIRQEKLNSRQLAVRPDVIISGKGDV
ncbi:hypothetical protein [Streptomyces albogriseolus]